MNRCDCAACSAFRLAIEMFVVGLLIIFAIAAALHAAPRREPLIGKAAAPELHKAADRNTDGSGADRRAYDLCPFIPAYPRRGTGVHQV